MIYMKLILAFLLSAMPFLFASHLRCKDDTSSKRNSLLSYLDTKITHLLPLLKALYFWMTFFLQRVYDGMKKSDNFRKFFTNILLLLMIALQFVDFCAYSSINTTYHEILQNNDGAQNYLDAYGPLMSSPVAIFMAATFSVCFFFYRLSDRIMTMLHNHKRLFVFTAELAIVLMFISPRYIVLTEMMELLLMAALIYPNMVIQDDTKRRKHIPFSFRKSVFILIRKAA